MSKNTMTLRDTIEPKSDQLNYEDVVAGPMTLKVTGLKMGSAEQPVRVTVADAATDEPKRDYCPCKSMRRILVALWGDNGKDWVGKSLTIYADHGVTWAGKKIGGIRISHVSGIEKTEKLLLSVSRGKRSEFTIQPIS